MEAHSHRVYLDHAATTPLDRRVARGDAAATSQAPGATPPASTTRAVRRARRSTAPGAASPRCWARKPNDIVFTSGGSESDNAAIRGVAFAPQAARPPHHHQRHRASRRAPRRRAARARGLRGDLPARRRAKASSTPTTCARALRPDTTLVSVMYANNEVGTIEPIAELARVVKDVRPPHRLPHRRGAGRRRARPRRRRARRRPALDRRRTSSTGRRASARSTSGRARRSSARSRRRPGAQPPRRHRERRRRRRPRRGAAPGLRRARRAQRPRARPARLPLATSCRRDCPACASPAPSDRDQRLPNNFSCLPRGRRGRGGAHPARPQRHRRQQRLRLHHRLAGAVARPHGDGPARADVARGSLRLTLGKDNTRADIDRLLEVLPRVVTKLRALSPLTATSGSS